MSSRVFGVMAATKGRSVDAARVEQLASAVEDEIRLLGHEVTSSQIGLCVLDQLRVLDEVEGDTGIEAPIAQQGPELAHVAQNEFVVGSPGFGLLQGGFEAFDTHQGFDAKRAQRGEVAAADVENRATSPERAAEFAEQGQPAKGGRGVRVFFGGRWKYPGRQSKIQRSSRPSSPS